MWPWNLGSGSLRVNETGTTRKLGYSFLIAVHGLSSIVSKTKRDTGRKSWLLHIASHSTPPLGGGFPSEYYHVVWCGKTRTVCLHDGEKTLIIYLAILTEYQRVTDRRTDIFQQHSPHYAQHRAVKSSRAQWRSSNSRCCSFTFTFTFWFIINSRRTSQYSCV